VGFGPARAEGDRLAEQFNSLIDSALVLRDHSQVMEGAGVVGLSGEYLPIKLLRFVQPPGLMALHRLFERLLERRLGHVQNG